MRTLKKLLLFAALLSFVAAMSACSLRQNSAAVQQTPAERTAVSGQSDSSNQTGSGTQPNNQAGQDKSGSQPASTQSKDNPGDPTQPGGKDKPGSASGADGAGQVKAGDKSGLPAKALVFTYNADCCESTRQFFDQHRDSVKDLENKYGNRVKFTWYDVAVKDQAYQKDMLEMAKKVGVQNIPAFVALDMNGNVLTRQIGQLDMEEVNKIFEGLNR